MLSRSSTAASFDQHMLPFVKYHVNRIAAARIGCDSGLKASAGAVGRSWMQPLIAEENVAVRAFGAGPPLVLLHSLLADATSFDPVVPALSRDFRVLVVDLPGFGGSAPVPGGLEAVADRVGEA